MEFKKGDRVKLIRGEQEGDTCGWLPHMKEHVGKEGTVYSNIYTGSQDTPVTIDGIDDWWNYPTDALQLVEEKKEEVMATDNKELIAQQLYIKLQSQIDIKVGDTVELIGSARQGQLGWYGDWDYELDDKVDDNAIALVEYIDSTEGYELKFIDDIEDADNVKECESYYVPFFCIQKTTDYKFEIIEISDEYSAFISENGVKVGCQTIDLGIAVKVGEAAARFLKK